MKNNFLSWVKNNIEWLLLIFATLAIASPFLLTRSWTHIDFSNTGQIGDTIGGLTAPILSFLTIVLLYLTLKEQIQSNEVQKDIEKTNRDYDIVFNQFTNLKHEFENIKISIVEGGRENSYTGTRAFFEFRNVLEHCTNITDCMNEYSVRAFCLSYTYLNSSLFFLLKRNYESNLSIGDKESIYTVLVQFKTPLLMVSLAAAIYGEKKKTGRTDIDKAIVMLSLMRIQFETEFDKLNPKALAKGTSG